MTQIRHLYDECAFDPFPGWVVDEEDRRIYSDTHFGSSGDAWATVVTAQLGEEPPVAGLLSRLVPRRPRPELDQLSTWLQLRVCSPSFQEIDPRFLVAGRHVALVQEEFDLKAVRRYFEKRIQDNARLNLSKRYRDWAKYFHLYDPDDD